MKFYSPSLLFGYGCTAGLLILGCFDFVRGDPAWIFCLVSFIVLFSGGVWATRGRYEILQMRERREQWNSTSQSR